MRLQTFQTSVVNRIRQQLPRPLKTFHARSFFALVKIHYADPKIHYEFAARGAARLIEIGLHFEADKATNDALRAVFEQRAAEIKYALGARVEVEEWTAAWSRVHEVVPYTTLDEKLVESVALKTARMIATLEPMVRKWQKKK